MRFILLLIAWTANTHRLSCSIEDTGLTLCFLSIGGGAPPLPILSSTPFIDSLHLPSIVLNSAYTFLLLFLFLSLPLSLSGCLSVSVPCPYLTTTQSINLSMQIELSKFVRTVTFAHQTTNEDR